ncbi:MAG TPA: hypothetical protein VL096_19890, partial [Pirellulaceae bacterium]|nr:hypothetical protein [Pirellulaceae bacterium]
LSRTGGLPCQIIMGRIVLSEQRGLASRSDAIENAATGARETLCIQSNSGQSVIRYELTTKSEHLTLDFVGQGELTLRREPRGDGHFAAVTFVQPLSSKLRLEVIDGEQRREFSAPSLWHLLLMEPKACQEHLLPLLEHLKTDWQLAARADAIDNALQLAAAAGGPPDQSLIAALVEDFAADQFAVRQAADRKLRGLGLAVLPQLSQLDMTKLDAEQRHRIAEVRRDLLANTPDTPERVALWLIGDLELLKRLAANKPALTRSN